MTLSSSRCTWVSTGHWLWVTPMRTIIFLPCLALFCGWSLEIIAFFNAKCCMVVCLFTTALLLFQVIDLKSKTVKSYDSMGQRHDDICSLLLLVFFLHLSFYLAVFVFLLIIFWHYLFLFLHIYDEFQAQMHTHESYKIWFLPTLWNMLERFYQKKKLFFMFRWCKMNFNRVFAFFLDII